MFFDTFLYYTLFASAVIIYGVGINSVGELGIYKRNQVTYFIKFLLSIFTSSVLTWLVTQSILLPLKLVELFPFAAFLIFICVNTFIEALIRITTGFSSSEFIISYLILLLSVSESTSLISTMTICVSCFFAFLILLPFSFTFKNRIQRDGYEINEKYYCLFFIFMGLLILLASTWDILWLTPGVIK